MLPGTEWTPPKCCVEKADSACWRPSLLFPSLPHSLVPLPRSTFSQVLSHFYVLCQSETHPSLKKSQPHCAASPNPHSVSKSSPSGSLPSSPPHPPLQGAGQSLLKSPPSRPDLVSAKLNCPDLSLKALLCPCLICWATSSSLPSSSHPQMGITSPFSSPFKVLTSSISASHSVSFLPL